MIGRPETSTRGSPGAPGRPRAGTRRPPARRSAVAQRGDAARERTRPHCAASSPGSRPPLRRSRTRSTRRASSSGWSARWQCESIRPGAIVHPPKSSTSSAALGRRAPRGSIETMRSASIVTATSSSAGPPEPSKRRSARSVERRGSERSHAAKRRRRRRRPGTRDAASGARYQSPKKNVFSCSEHRTRPTSARIPSSEFPERGERRDGFGLHRRPAERRALTRSSTRN